jgi:hypothetical protein
LELPDFGLSKDGGVEDDVKLNGGVVTSLSAGEGGPLFQGVSESVESGNAFFVWFTASLLVLIAGNA